MADILPEKWMKGIAVTTTILAANFMNLIIKRY